MAQLQLWWHLYGAAVPDKWDVTILSGQTPATPETAKTWTPKSEIDGVELSYLASWDHRPTIAEMNVPKVHAGLTPDSQADNCDEYGDPIAADDDDDYGDDDMPF